MNGIGLNEVLVDNGLGGAVSNMAFGYPADHRLFSLRMTWQVEFLNGKGLRKKGLTGPFFFWVAFYLMHFDLINRDANILFYRGLVLRPFNF